MSEETASALPPVVDRQTWQNALDDLRVREKAAPVSSTPSLHNAGDCRWSSSRTTT